MRIVRKGQRFAEVELGDLTVFALSDGQAMMPADCARLPGADAPGTGDPIRLEVFAFLVRGPGGTVLIDAGAGNAWKDSTGKLMEALAEARIRPEEVDQIALSHTHIDHIGGLVTADGGRAFPMARRILVPTEEILAFRDMPRMRPVLALILPLEQGDGIMPGVAAINAPGHSPGHMAFLVEGRLLIWGDLVHLPDRQFAQPGIGWKYDSDLALARATRQGFLARAVTEGLAVAGAHLSFPAIGHVMRQDGAYAFDPVGD